MHFLKGFAHARDRSVPFIPERLARADPFHDRSRCGGQFQAGLAQVFVEFLNRHPCTLKAVAGVRMAGSQVFFRPILRVDGSQVIEVQLEF
ncbi:hypothetical protein DJ564_22155 [Pseudomonas sp. 31-12]|nr:hypothetical protein DJ564_22155 [Pseudomonas sp. 31-12]